MVDAPVEDEADLVVPAEVVLVPVAVAVAVVAVVCLMLPVVTVLFDETITTDDDGVGTGGTLVLAEGMTVATAG